MVNLGALGVATEIDLAVEPTFEVEQSVYEKLPWEALQENFDAVAGCAYSVSLFTTWHTPDVIDQVWVKRRPDRDSASPAGFFGAQPADAERHPIPGMPPIGCTPQFGVPGPWFDRLPHFRLDFTPSNGVELQSEYLLPRKYAADNLWLSSSYGTDAVGLHFTWVKDQPAVEALLPEIESILEPFEARPHWGKLFTTSPLRLETLYPKLPDFRALVQRLDPDGVFQNAFLRGVLSMPAASLQWK